jgi:hypothetical protein
VGVAVGVALTGGDGAVVAVGMAVAVGLTVGMLVTVGEGMAPPGGAMMQQQQPLTTRAIETINMTSISFIPFATYILLYK